MSLIADLDAEQRQAKPCPIGLLARTDPQLAAELLEALGKRGTGPGGYAYSARLIADRLAKQGHRIGRDVLGDHRSGPCGRCPS